MRKVNIVWQKPGCCSAVLASFSGRSAGHDARIWLDGFRSGLCELDRSAYDQFNAEPWLKIDYEAEEE